MQDASEPGVTELIIDQVEELFVTLVDEIRERPGVALAIAAAILGILVGSALARGASRKRQSPVRRATRSAKGLTESSELLGLTLRLLQNPIVRGYLAEMLKRRFAV